MTAGCLACLTRSGLLLACMHDAAMEASPFMQRIDPGALLLWRQK